jgi:hypothetical protein
MKMALFATCKEITMQTFYFISLDGFLQFASVKATTLTDAIAQLANAFANDAPNRFWVPVTEDEYWHTYCGHPQ